MLVMSLCRIHVVVALISGALAGGLIGGLGMEGTLEAFNKGLGAGATVALSYALLGAFAVAIGKSGLANALADKVLTMVGRQHSERAVQSVKWLLVGLLLAVSVASQNVLPIHIAFIPLLVPPLLHVLSKLQIDRRLVACVITFGLVTPYMFLPVGFGSIFLNNILLANVAKAGVDVSAVNVSHAMLIPALGMVCGLLLAVLVSYRNKRVYDLERISQVEHSGKVYNPRTLAVAALAVAVAFAVQLWLGSMIVGALAGFVVFTVSGVVRWREADDLFTEGMKMMAMIGFIMIAAQGFAEVMTATGGAAAGGCRRRGDRQQPWSGRVADAAGRPAGDHGHRLLVLHRADHCGDLRALVRGAGLQPDGNCVHCRHRRCVGRCRFAGLRFHPGADLGLECGWPAQPHLGLGGAHLPALQPAVAGLRLDRGDGAVNRPVCRCRYA